MFQTHLSLYRDDRGTSVLLVWGEAGVSGENPPVMLNDHKPSQEPTPGIEPGTHW